MFKKENFSFLLNPWAVIAGMVTGVLIGIYFQGIIKYIAPIGEIYISILKMII